MKRAYIYDTVLGKILIVQDKQGITEVSLFPEHGVDNTDGNISSRIPGQYDLQETDLIKETAEQLKEYLKGERKEFTVKLNPQGTQFQEKVWEALRAIPYGETRSYKQIAEIIGNGKASRAVGMANHNNPIMCIIPCHRVIGANGRLVGYAGGLPIKEKLLELEKEGRMP